ncbi:MAG TPA: hypothetical protein VGM92_09825 [Candidatus Kapabacteria bacterium]|jgi:hypothetical protein
MFYLFAATIIIGLSMAYIRFRGEPYPATGMVVIHFIFAAVALASIIIVAANDTNRTSHVTGPMILFCIVAVLGLVQLFGYHQRKKPLPKALVIVHGALAIAAFIWLLA